MYRVYHAHYTSGPFGKVLHLAVLGLAVLILGPIGLGLAALILGLIVAVVGTALPFVVVGALVYGPYLLVRRALGHRRPEPTAEVRRVFPAAAPVRPVAMSAPLPAPPQPRKRSVVMRVIGEVLSGALVGALLGAVVVVGPPGDWHTGTLVNYASLGAGIGAVVGFIVGGPRPARTEKTPLVS
jgi:hypothetical protein